MKEAFSKSNRLKTFILLALSILLTVSAAVAGVDDNPPGFVMALLAGTAVVLAFVHPWRSTRKFLFLLLGAVLGFILFIALSILLDSITQNPASSLAFRELVESSLVNIFNTTFIMLCLAALLVGIVGWIAMIIRNKKK